MGTLASPSTPEYPFSSSLSISATYISPLLSTILTSSLSTYFLLLLHPVRPLLSLPLHLLVRLNDRLHPPPHSMSSVSMSRCAAHGLLRGPRQRGLVGGGNDKVVSTHLLNHLLAASLVLRAPWKAISCDSVHAIHQRAGWRVTAEREENKKQ